MFATAIASKIGLTNEEIRKAIESTVEITGMRLQSIPYKEDSLIINDAYNASPTSMKAGVDVVSSFDDFDYKTLVLGSMFELGPNEVNYHGEVGEYISNNTNDIDLVISVGELAENITKQIKNDKIKTLHFPTTTEVSEYLKNRYKSKVVAYLSTLAMIVFLIAAMSAQWVGGAKLLAAFMGINYKTGIVIISIIIIFCVVFGGLKNILITDMIQGLIMIFSTIILLYSVISYGSGIENITNNLLNINEKILTPFGANGSLTPSYVSSFWVLVGVGVIGIPQIAINSMLYKNKRSLKQSIIIGSIVIFIVMFGVHLIGVMARGVFPDIKDYDSVIPIITLKVLPWYLAALVLAAPMAAIITTVNAQFLLISSALIKDVLFSTKVIKEKIVGRKIPIFVYSINILVIILIMFISMRPPSLIVNVNLFAFGGLESTFLWPILLGLYWKGAEKYGAISSILVGLTSYIVFKNIYVIKAIEPVVISLMLSLIVFVFVSSIKRKKI